VIVLENSVEHGELVPWSHVDLESSDAVHDVAVDALGEEAVSLSTRLPIALEDGGGIGANGVNCGEAGPATSAKPPTNTPMRRREPCRRRINGRATPK
jgi:hypothetical protein